MKCRVHFLGAIVSLTFAVSSCQSRPVPVAPETSLAGTWKASVEQVSQCDKPAPVALEDFSFEILDAPLLNRSVSSVDYRNANVTGTVSARIHMEHSHPETIISGLLIGAIVKNDPSSSPDTAATSGVTLKGYVVSKEQYGAWVENKKTGMPPVDAGEVELQVSGNALKGYSLDGVVRSGETCANVAPLNPVVQYLTGNFGRGVPSKWSAHVILIRR